MLIGDDKEEELEKRREHLKELVKEGVNGYTLSLQDPEEAVEKINRILSDVKLRESMQEESYRIIQVHRIEKSLSKLEKIYESLLA